MGTLLGTATSEKQPLNMNTFLFFSSLSLTPAPARLLLPLAQPWSALWLPPLPLSACVLPLMTLPPLCTSVLVATLPTQPLRLMPTLMWCPDLRHHPPCGRDHPHPHPRQDRHLPACPYCQDPPCCPAHLPGCACACPGPRHRCCQDPPDCPPADRARDQDPHCPAGQPCERRSRRCCPPCRRCSCSRRCCPLCRCRCPRSCCCPLRWPRCRCR